MSEHIDGPKIAGADVNDPVRTERDVEFFFVAGMATAGTRPTAARAEYRAWLAAHDRALREQIARDIEQHYLGPDSGRCFDGRDAPDAAERDAFDEGLQFAAITVREGESHE